MEWSAWRKAEPNQTNPYFDWAYTVYPQYKTGPFEKVIAPNDVKALSTNGSDPDDLTRFPVPREICNPKPDFSYLDHDGSDYLFQTGIEMLPEIDNDTLVVGIIDVDIGFGHRRFRDKDGKTRVLAAWQQGARWKPDGHMPDLPFGDSVVEQQINDALEMHSQGDLLGALNEEAFNEELSLAEIKRPLAAKGLLKSSAHGTHVMGLLAGASPDDEPRFSDRVKLLVVNLPPIGTYGEGGGFLDYYLSYGMRWLHEAYDRIAKKSGLENPSPLLINVSFGKQAGVRDQGQELIRQIADINGKGKKSSAKDPINVIMPAGNDNLSRGHLAFDLEPNDSAVAEVAWRILPEDESSNIVEFNIFVHAETGHSEMPVLLDVVPPNAPDGDFAKANIGQVRDLGIGQGRLYAEDSHAVITRAGRKMTRYRYQICLAPTQQADDPNAPVVPAGCWKLRLISNVDANMTVRAHIQTDQATLPTSKIARQSYFDCPRYQRFDDMTREADSYSYTRKEEDRQNFDQQSGSIVQRHGTMNAYVENDHVVAVGGFRESDGRPASYSATGLGVDRVGADLGAPALLLPTEDGYAHFGILTDGPHDGSTAAVRGTSFASACAARLVLERWLAAKPGATDPAFDPLAILKALAKGSEGKTFYRYSKVNQDKAGAGRLAFQLFRSVSRM